MYRLRAITLAQARRSALLCNMAVGVPVVPLEACRRTTWPRGTANMPQGKLSRRSCFTVKGRPRTSSGELISWASTPARAWE